MELLQGDGWSAVGVRAGVRCLRGGTRWRPAGQHATTDAADSERTAVDPVIDLVSGVCMALSEVRGAGTHWIQQERMFLVPELP